MTARNQIQNLLKSADAAAKLSFKRMNAGDGCNSAKWRSISVICRNYANYLYMNGGYFAENPH